MIVEAVSMKYRSVKADDVWYNVDESLDLESVQRGMEIEILEKEDRGEKRNALIKNWEIRGALPKDNSEDAYKPIGNLYAMCEEKLDALIEQNVNIIDLLMKIARKNGIELDEIKPASKIEDKFAAQFSDEI